MKSATTEARGIRALLIGLALVWLALIILLPLLYGAMYLWAFWNPFNAVDHVPVALVNSDRGAVVQGQELRAGDQVSEALLKSGQLDLHVMSAESAAKAVKDGTSYFSITLPAVATGTAPVTGTTPGAGTAPTTGTRPAGTLPVVAG